MKDSFLYEQIYETLIDRINSGQYPDDSKLASEEDIKNEFEVSTITVKKALSMLTEDGIIKRIPGKGTFVTNQQEREDNKKEELIGVLFEHISSPYGLTIMYRLDHYAKKAGYKLIPRFSYGSREQETKEIDFLMELGVKGIIIMPSHGQHYNHSILKLVLDKFPVILIDKKLKGIEVPSVRTNNEGATTRLVEYLFEKNRRNIGLICVDEKGATSLEERRRGFKKAVARLGINEHNECHVTVGDYENDSRPNETTIKSIKEYLEQEGDAIDGVVLAEYGLAREFVVAVNDLGYTLGKEILACCVDEDYHSALGYTFTHVKQDESEIAKVAMGLLIDKLAGKELTKVDYKIEGIFCEYGTVKLK